MGCNDCWIWLLWSIKESVYKIISRKERRISFAPKSIECILVSIKKKETYKSVIEYKGTYFNAQSEVRSGYIHTIAVELGKDNSSFVTEVINIPKDVNESDFMNSEIVSALEKVLGISKNMFIYKGENREPYLLGGNKEIGCLSTSHHGRFGAFVLER